MTAAKTVAHVMAWLEAEAEVTRIRFENKGATKAFLEATLRAAELGDQVLESLKASFVGRHG